MTCFDFVLCNGIWENCLYGLYATEREGEKNKCVCVCVHSHCFCVCRTTHCSSTLTTHWHFVSLPPHVQHSRILKSTFFFFLTHAHTHLLCDQLTKVTVSCRASFVNHRSSVWLIKNWEENALCFCSSVHSSVNAKQNAKR